MTISPLLRAIRAIGTEFARRIYLPITITVGAILLVLLAVTSWLTTLSAWWWVLLTLLIVVGVIFSIVAIVSGLALRFLRPRQTKTQSRSVKQFVDKLQDVAETLQTPKVVILARLIKDVIAPSKQGFVSHITAHATSIRPDFNAIVASFK